MKVQISLTAEGFVSRIVEKNIFAVLDTLFAINAKCLNEYFRCVCE